MIDFEEYWESKHMRGRQGLKIWRIRQALKGNIKKGSWIIFWGYLRTHHGLLNTPQSIYLKFYSSHKNAINIVHFTYTCLHSIDQGHI